MKIKKILSCKHTSTVNRKRRIINQEDACMPVEVLGMDIGEWTKFRFGLIDMNGCQVDSVLWDVGMGSDSYSVWFDNGMPPEDFPGLDKWRKQGVDFPETLVAESHKRGLEAFWNERISEIDLPHPYQSGCPFDSPLRENHLKKAHPDWTVKCWWPHGLWNLASAGLREHKVKMLSKLIERYDFDGIQLDFARHTPCLPPGKEWENREHATEFVRMVRRMLLKMEDKRGGPLLLAVRVAENIPGCNADGFDVEKWAGEELVDIFTLGGRTAEVDIASFKKITAGKNIKLCPQFDGHHTNDGYYFPPTEYFRGVFSNWLEQGADSVGVFNWTCAPAAMYDALGLPPDMKCKSQETALFEAGSLEGMASGSKIYAAERSGYYPWAGNYTYKNEIRPLPLNASCLGESSVEFPVSIYGNFSEKDYRGTLDIICWNLLAEEMAAAELNGKALKLKNIDGNWSDPQIYCDKPQVTAGAWKAFPIAPEYKLMKMSFDFNPDLIKRGVNHIIIKLKIDSTFAKMKTIEKTELCLTALK
jgi:hypothetical protein